MRLLITVLVPILSIATPVLAQESFPATHLARLDIVEPYPNAGTIGGAALLAVDQQEGSAQLRVTVAIPGDAPATLHVMHSDGSGEQELNSVAFPGGTSTLTTTLPSFTAGLLAAVDSGSIWLAVDRDSDHARYVTGPIVVIPSAITPEPSGEAVVPPVTTTFGVGHCGLTYDPSTGDIRYSAWWLDLEGQATAARIRRAMPGSNGPVVLEMPLTPGSDLCIGTWQDPGAQLLDAIVGGELYFEVVTDEHPGGELRGQILPVEGFTAALEPDHVVPPATGTSATGTAFLLITAHGTVEAFNKLQGVIGGLSGPIAGAHLHQGAEGADGPAVAMLEVPTVTTIDLELATGSAGGTLSNAIVGQIRAAGTYVEVTTTAFASGEVRGQLIPAGTRLVPSGPTGLPSLTPSRDAGSTLAYDPWARAIVLTLDGPEHARSLDLLAADGRSVGALTCTSGTCRMSTGELASGLYLVRLTRSDGTVAGVRPVIVSP